jgi:DNA-binding IclR family transcriptional regulator
MARITSAERKTATDRIETGSSQARLVQGLSRGLSVLRAFTPGDTSLSNTEIAERTLLPKSTVSRLTQTLTGFGYLSYLPCAGRYALGPGIVALCHSLLASMPFRLAAKPVLQELANFSRLPVSLGTRDQLDILYIETAHRRGTRPARFDLGARMPIDTTSIGRAYLCALEAAERQMVLQRLRRERPRTAWALIRRNLDEAFTSVAARGFCCSFGDWRTDVYGVAAPVSAASGLAFAINCGGPPSHVSREFLEGEMGPRLVAAAARIAANLAAASLPG